MRSHARVLGHPLHPMLVILPSAAFPLLLLLDVASLWVDAGPLWTAGLWIAGAGALTTLVAMAPGFVDMHAIPDGTKAHRTVTLHMANGFLVLVLYVAAFWARWSAGPDARLALATGVDVLGVLAVGVQGWLGGELVYKHHVGVVAPEEGGEPVRLDGDASDARAPPRRREKLH